MAFGALEMSDFASKPFKWIPKVVPPENILDRHCDKSTCNLRLLRKFSFESQKQHLERKFDYFTFSVVPKIEEIKKLKFDTSKSFSHHTAYKHPIETFKPEKRRSGSSGGGGRNEGL